MKRTYAQLKSAVSQAFGTLVLLLVFLFSPSSVFAQRPFEPARNEIVNDVATLKGAEAIFENVITVVFYFAGIVLFVMLLTGGFRYLTSGGDPKAMEAAKGTLTHAVAGLVVLVLAYIIIQFIEVLTGVNVSTFRIYRP